MCALSSASKTSNHSGDLRWKSTCAVLWFQYKRATHRSLLLLLLYCSNAVGFFAEAGGGGQKVLYSGTPFVFLLREQASSLEEWCSDWQPLISAPAWRWLRRGVCASFCPWEDSQRAQLEMKVKYKVLCNDSVHSHIHPGHLSSPARYTEPPQSRRTPQGAAPGWESGGSSPAGRFRQHALKIRFNFCTQKLSIM